MWGLMNHVARKETPHPMEADVWLTTRVSAASRHPAGRRQGARSHRDGLRFDEKGKWVR
jgi:hypothetical protein